MRKIIYYCDRCGKETKNNDKESVWIIYPGNTNTYLCKKCYNDFLKFMKNNRNNYDQKTF